MTRSSALAAASIAATLALERAPALAEAPLRIEADRLLVVEPLPSRAAATRFALAQPIPATPYRRVLVRFPATPTVPTVTTEPTVARDGSLLVGTASPFALWWVAPDGSIRARALLPARPIGAPLEGADGRVFLLADGQRLLLVAPDASVRANVVLPRPVTHRPMLGAGDSVTVVLPSSRPELVTYTRDLVPAHSTPLPGAYVERSELSDDGAGCAWLSLTVGLSCLRPDGVLRTVAGTAGTFNGRALDARTVSTQREHELQFRDARTGAVRARVDLGTTLQLATPLPGRGIGLVRNTAPPELLVYSTEGVQVARAPLLGGMVRSVLVDPTGALLVVYRDGELAAFEPDGTARWRFDRRDAATHAPAPLPGGGLAIATIDARLTILVP